MTDPVPTLAPFVAMLCNLCRCELFRVEPDALNIKCKQCRGIHRMSRADLVRDWERLAQPSPKPLHFLPLLCEVWNRSVLRIIPGGIDAYCRHCKDVRHVSRRKMERTWEELSMPADKAQESTAQQDISLTTLL